MPLFASLFFSSLAPCGATGKQIKKIRHHTPCSLGIVLWQPITNQTTIGYKRILCFPTVTARKVRIIINESLACPVLNEIGIYNAPEIKEEAVETVEEGQRVSIGEIGILLNERKK